MCVDWMTIWDAGLVSAINITSSHLAAPRGDSADCPCPHMGESSSWCCSVSRGRSQHRQICLHWSYAGTYDHSLRIPEWKEQYLGIYVYLCVSNFIKYSIIFSSSHASCSIKSWKCMEMWHWQFQNLDETCATISYVHHLIRIHLSRFLLNPNVRMCGLSRSALGAVLRAVHVLTGICWQ